MPSSPELFTFTARLTGRETAEAIQIDWDTQIEWLPKSLTQISQLDDQSVRVSIPHWIARNKGLI